MLACLLDASVALFVFAALRCPGQRCLKLCASQGWSLAASGCRGRNDKDLHRPFSQWGCHAHSPPHPHARPHTDRQRFTHTHTQTPTNPRPQGAADAPARAVQSARNGKDCASGLSEAHPAIKLYVLNAMQASPKSAGARAHHSLGTKDRDGVKICSAATWSFAHRSSLTAEDPGAIPRAVRSGAALLAASGATRALMARAILRE